METMSVKCSHQTIFSYIEVSLSKLVICGLPGRGAKSSQVALRAAILTNEHLLHAHVSVEHEVRVKIVFSGNVLVLGKTEVRVAPLEKVDGVESVNIKLSCNIDVMNLLEIHQVRSSYL